MWGGGCRNASWSASELEVVRNIITQNRLVLRLVTLLNNIDPQPSFFREAIVRNRPDKLCFYPISSFCFILLVFVRGESKPIQCILHDWVVAQRRRKIWSTGHVEERMDGRFLLR